MTNATSDGASQLTAELEYVNDDVLVIHLAGRLDIAGLLQLRKMLRALEPDRPWLILDVAAVPEFHPSTVTVLAAAQRRVRCHGSRLVVWRPQSQPGRHLASCRLPQRRGGGDRPGRPVVEQPAHDPELNPRSALLLLPAAAGQRAKPSRPPAAARNPRTAGSVGA
jgi:anti-anti-sigma regulatory factor